MLFSLQVSCEEISAEIPKEVVIAHALRAMVYVPSFKQGLIAEKRRTGNTNLFIETTLTVSDSTLEQIVSRVFGKYLSRAQANELLEFYESPTGRALIADQARDPLDQNPQLHLNSSQMYEVGSFTNSATGKAFAHISGNQAIWKEIRDAIQSELVK